MFGKLKDKLKAWTKKFTSDVEEKTKKVIDKAEAKIVKDIKKETKKISKTSKKEINKDKKSKKEISMPMKFQVFDKSFRPDLEKLKELEKEIIQEKPAKKIQEKPKTIIKENPQTTEKETKESFFSKVKSKITKVKISEEQFDIYAEELEMLLLENNVAFEVAEKIIAELKEKVVGKELLKKEIEGQIMESFKDIIYEILIEPFDIYGKIKSREDKSKPFVILFCGINGTGKTTSIAKIADAMKKQNISCVLAAADTFRAASIEQIKKHGEKIGVPVIAHGYESDPASVGFDAIKYAEKNKLDCVLIDTAGRMHTSKNLMAQIEKIARVCNPDLKIYVGESTTGNDAIEQIRSFNFSIGFIIK